MDDSARLRYSRHLLLDGFDEAAQEALLAARVLIVGAGGLGSAAALYLAGAGVGHLTLIDDDLVDLTNLQRQIAHTTARIGQPKTASARTAMLELNPTIEVEALHERATPTQLLQLVRDADVVLDCCDNFETRHAVNVACVTHARPLVSGAAIRFDAQVSTFDTRQPDAPCYACAFPQDDHFEETRCATLGVFAPLVGIVGAMQAGEALKLLAGIGTPLTGCLAMLDAREMSWSEIRVARDPRCPVCASRPPSPH